MADLVDAVVVGGGILGTALTWALAKRNARVALLEAQTLAGGATGNGFAWVNATYKCDDADYFALNAQAVGHYDRLVVEAGRDRIGVYGGGSLFWAVGGDTTGGTLLRERARQLQALNYPALLLTPGELAVLEPNVAPPGGTESGNTILFAPSDKWVDTSRLCAYFVEQARGHKAEIRAGCAVTGFTRGMGNRISTVETTQGRISTGLVIIAAGIHTPALAGLLTDTPGEAAQNWVRQEPGLLVQTPPLPPHVRCHRVLYPPDSGGLHLRPTPDDGLLIGAEDVDAWLNSAAPQAQTIVRAARTASGSISIPETLWHPLLHRAARVLPGLPLRDLLARSVPRLCIRPVPADGLPVVGALPNVPGAYVAVTHSGVTLGPLLAELLANEIVMQAALPLLSRYRPTRF